MDKELPLVSIVTPSYNKGRFIEETILSVKNQAYSNIEHIVVDGGSTDKTLDILRKYSDSLIWISEPDEGQSDAINKGWRMSKGGILAYLNSDDTYTTWAVETAVEFLTKNQDVVMVYGKCNLIDENSNVIAEYPATKFNLGDLFSGWNMIPQPTVFIRKQVITEVGYLNADLHMAMDLDLWIRIGLKYKIEYIPEKLANFRLCEGTKSVSEGYKYEADHLYIFDKIFSDPELPKEIRRLKRKAYSGVHLTNVYYYQSTGDIKQAQKHFLKAFRLCPEYFIRHPWIFCHFVTSLLRANAARIKAK